MKLNNSYLKRLIMEEIVRLQYSENCGPDVEEEEEFSFTGDVGELEGSEAFGVGFTAALEEVKAAIDGLMPQTDAEDAGHGDEEEIEEFQAVGAGQMPRKRGNKRR